MYWVALLVPLIFFRTLLAAGLCGRITFKDLLLQGRYAKQKPPIGSTRRTETEKREGTVFKAAREIHSLVEQANVEHIGTGTGVAILLAKGIAGQTHRQRLL